jgi:LmbE family N-acetylglucosaminyl deacetylase
MTPAADFHRAWRSLALDRLDAIIGNGTCLILAPHPDDESLGCGGLIAACVAAGRAPMVVVLTDGAGSHPNSRAYPPARLRAVRTDETRNAVAQLGLTPDRLVFLGEPDTALPREGAGFDAVVKRLAALVDSEARCTAVLASWQHDPHCDHEAASFIAANVTAARGLRHVAYPVWGWTLPADAMIPETPKQGWRLDIRAFLPAKRAAIQAHRSQYGGLITDDPTGFHLPAELLSVFEAPYETFIQP